MKMKRFAVMSLALMVLLVGGNALAEDGGSNISKFMDYALFAAALGMAIASLGGAIAQGRTASSALEGIARNPGAADKMFVPMILGLVLIESLVIYSLVVEIMILTKWSP